MAVSLIEAVQQIDRQIKGMFLRVDTDSLGMAEKTYVKQIKLVCNEIRLDIRDYEYAENRLDQQKWAKVARRNSNVLEKLIIELDAVFGPSDVAALSAQLDQVRSALE